jgi:hypothetical protein
MKRLFILASLALFLSSLTASASQISYDSWVAGPGNYTSTPLIGSFTLPQFDSATWGTLTGVTLTYNIYWQNVSATVTNFATTGASYEVEGQLSTQLTGSTISTFTLRSILFDDPSTWPGDNGFNPIPIAGETTPGVPVVATIPITLVGTSKSGSPTVTAGLAAFIGTGTLDYDLGVQNSSNNQFTGGLLQYNQSAEALGELTITYDFTAPEPATLTFAGLGLLALGFFGRRFVRR